MGTCTQPDAISNSSRSESALTGTVLSKRGTDLIGGTIRIQAGDALHRVVLVTGEYSAEKDVACPVVCLGDSKWGSVHAIEGSHPKRGILPPGLIQQRDVAS